jgi:adenosine deaminase/aminodeoxyfutalosine deaminase
MMEFLHRLEKGELHLHLEGSIRPQTLRQIAPQLSEAEIHAGYDFTDFPGFLRAYKWITGFLKTPSDYALVTRNLLAELDSQNVSYVELNVSVGVMLWYGLDANPLLDAIHAESLKSRVRVRYIFDAVRQFGVDAAQEVAELAVSRAGRGVVGFGIGGDENRGPASQFRDVFIFADRGGLKLVPHAGENAGPESIWQSVELGAARIGHGIRAIEDPVLLAYLHDHDIPLEICISSNVRTGVVSSLSEHPVRRLYDAGVPVTLNTDDPALFSTSLEREYLLAAREFGFGRHHIEELAGNSLRYGFSAAPAGH